MKASLQNFSRNLVRHLRQAYVNHFRARFSRKKNEITAMLRARTEIRSKPIARCSARRRRENSTFHGSLDNGVTLVACSYERPSQLTCLVRCRCTRTPRAFPRSAAMMVLVARSEIDACSWTLSDRRGSRCRGRPPRRGTNRW